MRNHLVGDLRIGEAVKDQRRVRGWSQARLVEELAGKGLDIDGATMSRLETGRRSMSAYEASVFADVFGLTFEQLLAGPACPHCGMPLMTE